MEAPNDQIKENANSLSKASRVFSPKLSMSIFGANVSYNPASKMQPTAINTFCIAELPRD